jgi:hypothetical protein
MFLTMKRFTALSLGTMEPLDSQNTRLTCWFWGDLDVGDGSVEAYGEKK